MYVGIFCFCQYECIGVFDQIVNCYMCISLSPVWICLYTLFTFIRTNTVCLSSWVYMCVCGRVSVNIYIHTCEHWHAWISLFVRKWEQVCVPMCVREQLRIIFVCMTLSVCMWLRVCTWVTAVCMLVCYWVRVFATVKLESANLILKHHPQ